MTTIPLQYVDEDLDEDLYSNLNNTTKDEQDEQESDQSTTISDDSASRSTTTSDDSDNHGSGLTISEIMLYGIAFMLSVVAMQTAHIVLNPTITVPQFNVESTSMYPIQFDPVYNPLNISIAYKFSAGWNVILGVTNPSTKHASSYSNIVATIYYKETPLWVTMIPGFYQAEKSRDFVRATYHPAEPVTVDLPLAVSVLNDISSGSSSAFSIYLSGNLKECEKDGESTLGKKCEKVKASPLVASCKFNVVFSQLKSVLQGYTKN